MRTSTYTFRSLALSTLRNMLAQHQELATIIILLREYGPWNNQGTIHNRQNEAQFIFAMYMKYSEDVFSS